MPRPHSADRVRTVVIRLTIGSFSIAALLGIVALLTGGEFSQTQGNVILTTILVGVVSITVLCYLTTADRGFQWIGVAGGISVVAPTAIGLFLIWNTGDFGGDGVLKAFFIGIVLAASLAQASLLLSLADGATSGVRRLLAATLTTVIIIAIMIIVPIVIEPDDWNDWYFRILGVVAILDVLGTITVAALSKFRSTETPDDIQLTISPALDSRLVDAAQKSGRSKNDLIADALDGFLDGF